MAPQYIQGKSDGAPVSGKGPFQLLLNNISNEHYITAQRENKKKKRDRTRKNALFQAASAAPSRLIVLHTDPGVFSSFSVLQYLQCPGGWNDSKKKGVHIFSHSGGKGDVKTQTNGTRLYCFDHRKIFGISIAVLGCFS